jgi:CHAT domain-containing protein
VLDACQSADAAAAVPGNLSFADAVSRAGANHVVAALWPVSDSAAALWVPAFYQALTADPGHDAAQALRAAQQRLRSSRAFTHPFYWAGLQAIERIDVATPVPAASH